jgi:phage FluMu gp28-like protein
MHLAENLQRRHGAVVCPETFTNASKEVWCNDFKILLQRRGMTLPRDRELVAQIHSIRKSLTPSGKVSFEAPRTASGGHADRFWALVLAVQKERGPGPARPTTIGVRVIG